MPPSRPASLPALSAAPSEGSRPGSKGERRGSKACKGQSCHVGGEKTLTLAGGELSAGIARPPSGNSADEIMGIQEGYEKTALELDLKGLGFSAKWDVIGATNPHAYLRAEAKASPMTGWNHEAHQFSGMIGSVKMANGEQSRRSAVRAAASLPALPRELARQEKYMKETGSPFRVLLKATGLTDYKAAALPATGAIPRPDHLAEVEQGLLEMSDRMPVSNTRSSLGFIGMLPIATPDVPQSAATRASTRTPSTPAQREHTRKQTMKAVAHAGLSPVEAMVSISEFRRWCIETFRDAEYAWNTLNPAGNHSMNQDDFVVALRHHGYPADRVGIINLFRCCKKDEVITEMSFYDTLDSVSCGRTRGFTPTAVIPTSESQIEKEQDAEEAICVGTGAGSLAVRQGKILDRLKRSDAVVGELIEYLFKNVGTLKLAFKQLDINGNGNLSSQEFVDGLNRMKTKGVGTPIEAHMRNLFNRLDYEGTGAPHLEDFIANGDRDSSPITQRLWKFMEEAHSRQLSAGRTRHLSVVSCANAPDVKPQDGVSRLAHMDGVSRLAHMVRLFKVGHATSPISCEQFIFALNALKYPSFHANECFRRLDKDDSGVLSLAEFTAFLQRDVPVRREVKGPVKPLGNEYRIKQVTSLYSASENSYKLRLDTIGGDKVTIFDKLQMRSPTAGRILLAKSHPTFSSDGGFKRPDYLGLVDEGMAESRSCSGFALPKLTELSKNGSHLLRVHADPLRDLAPQPGCVRKFNENAARCRISAF